MNTKTENKKVTKKEVMENVKAFTSLYDLERVNKYNIIDVLAETVKAVETSKGTVQNKNTVKAFVHCIKFFKGAEIVTIEKSETAFHYIELEKVKKGVYNVLFDGKKINLNKATELVANCFYNSGEVNGAIDFIDNNVIFDLKEVANNDFFKSKLNEYIKGGYVAKSNSNKENIKE